jgi:hypothetical protein
VRTCRCKCIVTGSGHSPAGMNHAQTHVWCAELQSNRGASCCPGYFSRVNIACVLCAHLECQCVAWADAGLRPSQHRVTRAEALGRQDVAVHRLLALHCRGQGRDTHTICQHQHTEETVPLPNSVSLAKQETLPPRAHDSTHVKTQHHTSHTTRHATYISTYQGGT